MNSISDISFGGSAVPLIEALPWSKILSAPRTFLVNDAIDTDGRFLLYTLASQVLSSKVQQHQQGRVLWLGFHPTTEEQILLGLKKIGCDRSTISQTQVSSSSERLTIRNWWVELSTRMLDVENIDNFSETKFMKEILNCVEEWLVGAVAEAKVDDDDDNDDIHNGWIILDDVSTFSSLVGEQLMYLFILTLNAKSRSKQGFGVMIRCSNDREDESLPVYSGSSMQGYRDWFGAGGLSHNSMQSSSSPDQQPPWERSLIELADGVMDVLPLASGYTRELHGRIGLTQTPLGRGWGIDSSTLPNESGSASVMTNTRNSTVKQYPAMQIINYCITDQNPKIVAYIM